jgi:hypothetical protein
MAFRTYTKPVLLEPSETALVDTYVCEEDVKQGQVLKPGGTNSDEVEPSDTDGERVVGVALYDQSSGGTVEVVIRGKCRLTSGTGSISADDRIASHGATGEEGEVATAASGDHVIGFARFDDVGTNDDVEVYVDTVESGPVYGGAP